MLRNVNASRHPHFTFRLGRHILHEPLQRLEAAGLTDDAAVESNGHHLRLTGLTFVVQCVEGGLEVLIEGVGGEDAGRAVELEIVVVVAGACQWTSCGGGLVLGD